MSKITWYHFSDLHFGRSNDFDRSRVMNALWDDIRGQLAHGLSADFVVVTGDIAYSGKQQEYSIAEREFFQPLLEKTGLDRDRVFIYIIQ